MLKNILRRPVWNTLFISELGVCVLFVISVLVTLSSVGMNDIRATYQYDGFNQHETVFPFSVEQESDFLTIIVNFSLSSLHANHFVIGPDDCIELLSINNQVVHSANGLCDMHPGYALELPNLQSGANTLTLRIRDTGGTGGANIRVSMSDPLVLSLLALLTFALSWGLGRLIQCISGYREASALPFLLVVGLLLRLGLSSHGGFGGDIHLNQEWSRSAVQIGIADSYNRQVNPEVMLPNYPPLSILIFAATGYLYQQAISLDFNPDLPAFDTIIKLPAIVADLLTVVVLYLLLVPMGGRKKALLAATLYALHPAVIHDSSIWGQTDSLFTLFLCLTLFFVQKNRWFWVGFMIAGALLLKMQAIILLPVLAVSAGFHLKRWLMMIGGGITITLPTILPFLLKGSIDTVLDIYLSSVGYYTSLSYNAYNLWVMLYTRDTGKSATDLFLNIASYRTFGLIFWMIVIISVTFGWMTAIRNDVKEKGKTGVLMLSASMIAYAFFLFNAEMHERYLFPYMAFGLPLLLLGRKGVIVYASASLLFLLNLVSIVAFTDVDRIIVQETFGEALPVAVATANMIVFFITWRFLYVYQRQTVGTGPIGNIYLSYRRLIGCTAIQSMRSRLSRLFVLGYHCLTRSE